jgi:hypothetical protein
LLKTGTLREGFGILAARRRDGEIGRHASFRYLWGDPWRFKSSSRQFLQ